MTTTRKQAKRLRKVARKSQKVQSIMKIASGVAADLAGGKEWKESIRSNLPPLRQKYRDKLEHIRSYFPNVVGATDPFLKSRSMPLKVSAAPVALGSTTPASFFRRGGRAQVNTRLSGAGMKVDSERISFSDIAPYTIQLDGVPSIQKPWYNGASFAGSIPMSPNNLSARLVQVEEIYGFYAFRRLRLTYIPATGTSTTGQLALSIDQAIDGSPSPATGISITQVMQHENSKMGPVWEPFALDWTFTGTALWACTVLGAPDTAAYQQAIIFASTFNTVATGIYGKVHVEGEIDFYKMQELVASPALRERRLWDRFILSEWLAYRSLNLEKISQPEFFLRYREPIIKREREKLRLSEAKTSGPVALYDVDEKKSL
jgi:hypothetical protein